MEIRELQAQYITDSNGKKTAVILPIEEFEELLEDPFCFTGIFA